MEPLVKITRWGIKYKNKFDELGCQAVERKEYLVGKTTVEKLSGYMKFPRYTATSTNAWLFICCVNPESI